MTEKPIVDDIVHPLEVQDPEARYGPDPMRGNTLRESKEIADSKKIRLWILEATAQISKENRTKFATKEDLAELRMQAKKEIQELRIQAQKSVAQIRKIANKSLGTFTKRVDKRLSKIEKRLDKIEEELWN